MKVKQFVGMLEYLHFLYSSGGMRLSMDLLCQLRLADEKEVHWRKDDCQRKIEVFGKAPVLAPL
jgi:hypothetical protein